MLTPDQINIIHHYLRSQGVIYYDLQLELVDHIAADIEASITIEKHNTISNNLIYDELKKWPPHLLASLIKKKEKTLKRYWWMKAFKYLMKYFTPPKAFLLVGIIFSLTILFLNEEIYHWTISTLTQVSFITFGIYIVHFSYKAYAGDPPDTKPLLSLKSYNQTLFGSYSILYLFYGLFDTWGIPDHSSLMAIYMSITIALAVLIIHASIFVFPQWLRQDLAIYSSDLST